MWQANFFYTFHFSYQLYLYVDIFNFCFFKSCRSEAEYLVCTVQQYARVVCIAVRYDVEGLCLLVTEQEKLHALGTNCILIVQSWTLRTNFIKEDSEKTQEKNLQILIPCFPVCNPRRKWDFL